MKGKVKMTRLISRNHFFFIVVLAVVMLVTLLPGALTDGQTVLAQVAEPDKSGEGETVINGRFIESSRPTSVPVNATTYCSAPNLAIPDADPTGVVDTITITDTDTIFDLNVILDVNHTYIGDLTMQLEHAESGTTIQLMQSRDCSADNIHVTLDDEAGQSVQTACPLATNGSYVPVQSLRYFDFADISGTWNLRVADMYRRDRGTLNQWCLSITTPPTIVVAPTSLNAALLPDTQATLPLTITNQGGADLVWFVDEAENAAMSTLLAMPTRGSGKDQAGHSLSSSNNFAMPLISLPPASPAPLALQALVHDGDFENNPSAWNMASSSSDCGSRIGNWYPIWNVTAYSGSLDYWGGGYCNNVPVSSYITQTITVPADAQQLGFYYLAYRPDAGDDGLDYAYVQVDGRTLWTLDSTATSNTYPNWQVVRLDISEIAGETVTLQAGFLSTGALTGNVRLDFFHYIEETTNTCNFPGEIPWLKFSENSGSTAAGDFSNLNVTLDATGLEAGDYSSVICINSNDPATPLLEIPVSLTVSGGSCTEPPAPPELHITRNGVNAFLNWEGSNSDYYEIWWGINDPYFTPGDNCSIAENCIITENTSYIHHTGSLGNPHANYSYLVRGVNECGLGNTIPSPPSNRAAEFTFTIVPGS